MLPVYLVSVVLLSVLLLLLLGFFVVLVYMVLEMMVVGVEKINAHVNDDFHVIFFAMLIYVSVRVCHRRYYRHCC